MSDYCVYKYEFVPSGQKWAFRDAETDEKVDAEVVRRKWGEELKPKRFLTLYKKKKGEMVAVQAYVIARHDDVALLAVHNIKNLKQWEVMADKPTELESHPHCKVIIDNRSGVQQILIEKNEAFNSRPDAALWMLKRHIDALFAPLEVTVNLSGKIHVGDTWRVVEGYRKAGKDITSVAFNVGSRDQMDYGDDEKSDLLEAMFKWNQIMGAAFSQFRMQAKSKTDLDFCEANEDCRHLMRIIARNGYGLTIRFRGGGVYKSKSQSTAFFPIPANADNAFEHDQRELDGKYLLIKWLDEIRKDNEAYKDVKLKPKRS